jgi:hypothetical protein
MNKPIERRGRILTAITRCCIANDYEPVSTSQIMAFSHALRLYRGGLRGRDRNNMARAIRAAADRLCDRVGYKWGDWGNPILWALRVSNETEKPSEYSDGVSQVRQNRGA